MVEPSSTANVTLPLLTSISKPEIFLPSFIWIMIESVFWKFTTNGFTEEPLTSEETITSLFFRSEELSE